MDTVVVDMQGPMIWVRLTRVAVDVPNAINIETIVRTLKQAVADEFKTRFQTMQEFEETTEGTFF